MDLPCTYLREPQSLFHAHPSFPFLKYPVIFKLHLRHSVQCSLIALTLTGLTL